MFKNVFGETTRLGSAKPTKLKKRSFLGMGKVAFLIRQDLGCYCIVESCCRQKFSFGGIITLNICTFGYFPLKYPDFSIGTFHEKFFCFNYGFAE